MAGLQTTKGYGGDGYIQGEITQKRVTMVWRATEWKVMSVYERDHGCARVST